MNMLVHGIKNEQNVQDSPFKAHKNFMLQQRVLEAVIKCWKGEHGETIFAIVELAENMESQMPSSLRNSIERPTQLLYHLYSGFPETGECIISHWKDKRKWRDIFLPETVLIFAREVWPMLPVSAKPRSNPDMVMDASLKISFDAMVMELGHEDDFYDVSTYQNSMKVAAGIKRSTKAAFRPNDYRGQNVSDLFFYRMLRQLAKHPESPTWISAVDYSVPQEVTIAEAQILHNEHQSAFHAHELPPTTGCANHKEHTADDVIDMAEVQHTFFLDSGADMDVAH